MLTPSGRRSVVCIVPKASGYTHLITYGDYGFTVMSNQFTGLVYTHTINSLWREGGREGGMMCLEKTINRESDPIKLHLLTVRLALACIADWSRCHRSIAYSSALDVGLKNTAEVACKHLITSHTFNDTDKFLHLRDRR